MYIHVYFYIEYKFLKTYENALTLQPLFEFRIFGVGMQDRQQSEENRFVCVYVVYKSESYNGEDTGWSYVHKFRNCGEGKWLTDLLSNLPIFALAAFSFCIHHGIDRCIYH